MEKEVIMAKDNKPTPEEVVDDPWVHRSGGMRCKTCMWYVEKVTAIAVSEKSIGRCRRRCPTMNGYPVVFLDDWCGDHKLNEDAL
jgi:hypothetical protein